MSFIYFIAIAVAIIIVVSRIALVNIVLYHIF